MRDGSFIAFFDLGDDEAPQPSPNTPSWVNHLALEVPDEQHLRAAKAKLEQAGVEVLGVTDHEIVRSIYFFDPNGLRVELTTWTVDKACMDKEAAVARSRLDAWTRRKREAKRATARPSAVHDDPNTP
jgi:catechol-2,3-dioxygenase